MNYPLVVFLIIFSLLLITPSIHAQLFDESNQKSIEVKINSIGEVKVKHVVVGPDKPLQIDLINGTKENLIVEDEDGNPMQYATIGDMKGLMIFPAKKDVIIKYDLLDKLVMKENFWTMDFIYLQSTSFILPENADLIFVNNKPVLLGDKKGILCHGCQMKLEYSLKEPKIFEKMKINDKEYLFEIRTFSKINQFGLKPELDGISFETVGENNFVTIIIPVNFMEEPYEVFLDGEKILSHDYIKNGTHVWINVRPQNSGDVAITGTIIPDVSTLPSSDYLPFVMIGVVIIIGTTIGVFLLKRKKNQG